MKLSAVDQLNNIQQTQNQQSPDALRRAAMQFEAVLLMQLTSALNSTSSDDEDSLFGSDGGSGLAKQMFSEQLATTMSQSGGVGISDLILRQLSGNKPDPVSGGIKSLSGAISAVKEIKQNGSHQSNILPLVNRPSSSTPVLENGLSAIAKKAEALVPPLSAKVSLNASAEVTFQIPVNGRISSTFGTRFHPVDRKTKFHGGLDIAVPTGTSVAAAAAGTVTFAGWKGGYGNLVMVLHPDGRETRYGHLAKISVAEGDEVSGGQPIALSGSTGKSTGPHLHFEVRENGQVINPLRILSNVSSKSAER